MSDSGVLISESGDFLFSSRTDSKPHTTIEKEEYLTPAPAPDKFSDIDFLDSVDIQESSSTVTWDECMKIFELLKTDSTKVYDEYCFAPAQTKSFATSTTNIIKIDKFEKLFDGTFDVYTFNRKNYSEPRLKPTCLSYSLYVPSEEFGFDLNLDYAIKSLLNLLKTCQIIQTEIYGENESRQLPIIVRLYVNPSIFLVSEKTKENRFDLTLSILNELLSFKFFEYHQIYIPNFKKTNVMERQRMFRFFPVFDDRLSITCSKDIDSVITQFELQNIRSFFFDTECQLFFIDIYNDMNWKGDDPNNEEETNMIINLDPDDETETAVFKKKFMKPNPNWLYLYQQINFKTKFKYQVPAGLFMLKSDIISLEYFVETFNNVSTTIKSIIDSFYDITKMDAAERKNPLLYNLLDDYFKQDLEERNMFYVGFDEIFLMNLFQPIPEKNVVELKTFQQKYSIPRTLLEEFTLDQKKENTFSTRPQINNYKTMYKLDQKKNKLYYTPTSSSNNQTSFVEKFFKNFFF